MQAFEQVARIDNPPHGLHLTGGQCPRARRRRAPHSCDRGRYGAQHGPFHAFDFDIEHLRYARPAPAALVPKFNRRDARRQPLCYRRGNALHHSACLPGENALERATLLRARIRVEIWRDAPIAFPHRSRRVDGKRNMRILKRHRTRRSIRDAEYERYVAVSIGRLCYQRSAFVARARETGTTKDAVAGLQIFSAKPPGFRHGTSVSSRPLEAKQGTKAGKLLRMEPGNNLATQQNLARSKAPA
jgi:hypothetical protein